MLARYNPDVTIGMLAFFGAATAFAQNAELIGVRKIWDQAPHNAFTDLIRHDGWFYCVFREGSRHVSPDGALRVIRSRDGETWESAALIQSADGDLRDAKISATPDGRLMLAGAIALPDDSAVRHRSMIWLSRNGLDWTAGQFVADPNYWLWRITWKGAKAYGVAYLTERERRGVRLYEGSADGFRPLVDDLGIAGYPNESAIRFDADGTAYCLLRRDPWKGAPHTALLGRSSPPYREWTWSDLGVRIGGPEFQIVGKNSGVAAVRLYEGAQRTSVCALDLRQGAIREVLRLPSSGDSSYAGIVRDGAELWISYYSSHEGKSSIYLARVRYTP
jgi:hypothetical protein